MRIIKIVLILTMAGFSVHLFSQEKKTGCISGDCIKGEGVFVYSDGISRYTGRWKNGKRNGPGNFKGKYSYLNPGHKGEDFNVEFKGNWKEGKRYGQGTFIALDGKLKGTKYIGLYENNVAHGNGIYYYPGGRVQYSGGFKMGKYHGSGTANYRSGNVYKGQFKEGKRHGMGHYNFRNGDRYVGQLENGKFNGKGRYDSKRRGFYYVGRFKNGRYNGKGIIYYKNGNKYDGHFKGGKRHGKGFMHYKSGLVKECTYQKGRLIKVIEHYEI
ncbi:MORN repeat-containing protein [Spirochaetota bacterium]